MQKTAIDSKNDEFEIYHMNDLYFEKPTIFNFHRLWKPVVTFDGFETTRTH